jgi:catechol 2,3-dioxygenase-like lactoylglutathione lyase family enzyme
MAPKIQSLDHLVLTVSDLQATIDFYEAALGMTPQSFAARGGKQRRALGFGQQKINLHQAGAEFEPKATRPTPGSADLCFLSETPVADWLAHWASLDLPVLEGPVDRTGAQGPLVSVYLRDPDGNLIEVSNPA